MPLVTQANIDAVNALQKKFGDVGIKVGELQRLLLAVFNRIDLDNELNDGTDWDAIVTLYLDDYDTAIAELKVLVEDLDRWPT